MTQILTICLWQSIDLGSYKAAEYACDYVFQDGECIGQSLLYYTGNYR